MRENLPSMGPAPDDNRPRLRVVSAEKLDSTSAQHGAPNGRAEKPASFFRTGHQQKETPPAALNRPKPLVPNEKTPPANDLPPRPTLPALPASPADVLLKAYAPRRETEVPAPEIGGTSVKSHAPAGGRPRLFDEHKMGQVCGLLAAGMSRRQAAHVVGCDPNTIRNEARRNEKFADDIKRAEAHAELAPLKCLYNAATKHWRAAAWLLEKQDRKRQEKKNRKRHERTLKELMLDDETMRRAFGS